MKAHPLSELIEELTKIYEIHGDIPVIIVDSMNKPVQILSICYPTTRRESVIKIG